MIIELLTFGNELLDGRRVDTNTAWLGRELTALGLSPRFRQTTADDMGDLVTAIQLALSRSDLIISTGGLGPTSDDLTFEALAKALDRKLVLHPELWERIQKRFEARGLKCPISNRRQAMLPEGAEEIRNDWGTAPGIRLDRGQQVIFALPGVPTEMMNLFERGIRAEIQKRIGNGEARRERTFKFCGISESHLEERVEKLGLGSLHGGNIVVAYTASFPQIDVTLSAQGTPETPAVNLLEVAQQKLKEVLGEHLVAIGEETLEGRVIEALAQRKWRLAVAESLTGGLISGQLVNVSGSSKVLDRGVVTYSNDSKVDLIGVEVSTLEKYGAVSSETALEMARGVRQRAGVEVGMATTGIAGPEGGTAEKPVGLTFISWVGPDFEEVKRYQFRWDRNRNRMLATVEALMGLLRLVAGPRP